MKVVKNFEEFLEEGTVKKITPDKQRAKSLILEAERKLKLLEKNITKIGLDDENANDYIEYCYNILIFVVRGKMLLQGYASAGQGAHEAEIVFTKKMGFKASEVEFFDQLRYFRNGILYYGKRFDAEYATKTITFTKQTYEKLKKI